MSPPSPRRRALHVCLAGACLLAVGCGSDATTPAATATPSASPAGPADHLITPTFTLPIPKGWHSRTIDDRGENGVLYGISNTVTGAPEDGVAPPGVIDIHVEVVALSAVPSQAGDISNYDPAQLLGAAAGYPPCATAISAGDVRTAALDGAPAALASASYICNGSKQTDIAVASRRGTELYLFTLDTTPPDLAEGTSVFIHEISAWQWRSGS